VRPPPKRRKAKLPRKKEKKAERNNPLLINDQNPVFPEDGIFCDLSPETNSQK